LYVLPKEKEKRETIIQFEGEVLKHYRSQSGGERSYIPEKKGKRKNVRLKKGM